MQGEGQGTGPSLQQRRQFKYGRVEDVSHGVRYAEGGFGEPLVFLPGMAGLQVTRAHHDLAERYRLIGFDVVRLREAFAGSPTATRDVALHLILAIDAFGIDSFNLLGSAFGANVALQIAVHQPRRVRSLILAAPTAIRADPAGTGPSHSEIVSSVPAPGIERELATVTVPVLVLFGAEDIVVPPETGHIYQQRLPNCHFMLVENAGHAIEDDEAGTFVSVVGEFVAAPDAYLASQQGARAKL